MIGMLLVLTACTEDSNADPESDSGDEGSQTSGGDFILSVGNDVVSLDPHGSNDLYSDQVRNTIYEGLVTQNEALEIAPLLANEWEQVDETTWRFTLEEEVTFHDGSEFNAEVVKANFDRVLDPAVASPRLNIFEMVEEVNVIDDYQVEIVTSYPFAPLLAHLTPDGGGLISKEVIDEDYRNAIEEAGLEIPLEEFYELRNTGGAEYEDTAESVSEYLHTVVEQKPTGTGYLQFEERTPGENTVLARYEEYWQEPAKLDTVTFKVVSGNRIKNCGVGNRRIPYDQRF